MKRIGLRRTLVGVAVALVTLMVGLVLWNGLAGNGWPWERVYRVSVLVRDPANIEVQSEVRVGSETVGNVEGVEALTVPSGGRAARVTELALELEAEQEPLTLDTRFEIRTDPDTDSSYLEIIPSPSGGPALDGLRFPLRNSTPAETQGGR